MTIQRLRRGLVRLAALHRSAITAADRLVDSLAGGERLRKLIAAVIAATSAPR